MASVLGNAAHASQSPQSNTRSPDHRSQGRLSESAGTMHTSIFLTVIVHAQLAAAVQYTSRVV